MPYEMNRLTSNYSSNFVDENERNCNSNDSKRARDEQVTEIFDVIKKTPGPARTLSNETANPISFSSKETQIIAIELPNYYPGTQGCRDVAEYKFLNRIEEGTYGIVFRARNKRTDEIVALKRLKNRNEEEGFSQTLLREIKTLLKAQHPNIVSLKEIVVGSNCKDVFLVMDFIEQDIQTLIHKMSKQKQNFLPHEIKCIMQQLLSAVKHLHDNWILHRDLKTSNLLLSNEGVLKVADFGMSREYCSPLKTYTSLVVTRWYRAPELLLCSPIYSTSIDIWSIGCIFAELLLMAPYLQGTSDIDQLHRIFKELGMPNKEIWPGYSELPFVKNTLSQHGNIFTFHSTSKISKRFKDKVSNAGVLLLQSLLTYNPKVRITAEDALNSFYFEELPKSNDCSSLNKKILKSKQENFNGNNVSNSQLDTEFVLKF